MLVVQSDIEKLEQLFTVINKERVTEFLNPELVQLILEAHGEVQKYFPDDELELEVVDDPEEWELTQLVLRIMDDQELEEAMRLENELVDNWWLSNMTRANSKLHITME